MEVDLFERHAVNRGLGERHLAEDRFGRLPGAGRQVAAREDRFDVRQEAVIVLVLGQHVHLHGGEPAPLDALHFEPHRQPQRGDGVLQRGFFDADIDERAERHVAADAAEAIEVRHLHVSSPRRRRAGHLLNYEGPASEEQL